MGYIDKEYLSTQFRNFANKIASTFSKIGDSYTKEESDNILSEKIESEIATDFSPATPPKFDGGCSVTMDIIYDNPSRDSSVGLIELTKPYTDYDLLLVSQANYSDNRNWGSSILLPHTLEISRENNSYFSIVGATGLYRNYTVPNINQFISQDGNLWINRIYGIKF